VQRKFVGNINYLRHRYSGRIIFEVEFGAPEMDVEKERTES
jgi:hypothetical protein